VGVGRVGVLQPQHGAGQQQGGLANTRGAIQQHQAVGVDQRAEILCLTLAAEEDRSIAGLVVSSSL